MVCHFERKSTGNAFFFKTLRVLGGVICKRNGVGQQRSDYYVIDYQKEEERDYKEKGGKMQEMGKKQAFPAGKNLCVIGKRRSKRREKGRKHCRAFLEWEKTWQHFN